MLIPPRLEKGDTIGIAAPAGPVDAADLDAGLGLLKQAGYKVQMASHVQDKQGYLAGTDPDRLADLHTFFRDRKIKAVFFTRGGYGTLRLLDRLDYALIQKNPKIVAGYSDITALLMAIYVQTGLITFYGPMLRGLDQNNNANWLSLRRLITSDGPLEMDLKGCRVLAPGKGTGPLIGGNLSMMCHLAGTPFSPSLEKAILFLEDTGEPVYRVDRMLTHLKLTGRLNRLNGVVAGRFKDCGPASEISRLFSDQFSPLGIPLISEFPIGHGPQNLALPLGPIADLDTQRMTMTVKGTCVT